MTGKKQKPIKRRTRSRQNRTAPAGTATPGTATPAVGGDGGVGGDGAGEGVRFDETVASEGKRGQSRQSHHDKLDVLDITNPAFDRMRRERAKKTVDFITLNKVWVGVRPPARRCAVVERRGERACTNGSVADPRGSFPADRVSDRRRAPQDHVSGRGGSCASRWRGVQLQWAAAELRGVAEGADAAAPVEGQEEHLHIQQGGPSRHTTMGTLTRTHNHT